MQLKYFENICSDWQHWQHSYTPTADGKRRGRKRRGGEEKGREGKKIGGQMEVK